MKPPVPYRGDEPYIFISYSHKDSRKVWPVIEQMQADGYRVWYDEGIDPGTEWDENIAAHVTGCDYFIAFISKNYINSENCKDELNFSRDLGKKQLLIYLEDTNLPDSMDLRFGRCQSISKNGKGNFYQRLYDAEGISSFTNGVKTAVKRSRFNSFLLLIPLAALAAALFLFKPSGEEALQPTTGENLSTETTTADENRPLELDKRMIFNKNNVTLTVQDMYLDEEGALILDTMAENKNDHEVEMHFHTTYINSIRCYPEIYYNLPASSESNIRIRWRPETFDEYNVGEIDEPTDVRKIEASIIMSPFPDDHYFTYYPYGEENNIPLDYVPDEDDIMLYEDDMFMTTMIDHFYDEKGRWVAEIVSHNKTDRMMDVAVSSENTNGYEYGFHLAEDLREGSMVRSRVFLDEWQVTGADKVRRLEMEVRLWDTKAYDQILVENFTIYPEGDEGITFETRVLEDDDRIILENEDLVVAIIDEIGERNYGYDFLIYGYNKSDKALRFELCKYKHDGEMIAESGWNMAVVDPGEQFFETLYLDDPDNDKKISVDFELVIKDNVDAAVPRELYREPYHLDYSW
ncbi:MAG: toll/interleukin-1 receptor domain-containing protein [Clostridia bacterium]|nr:toll/interleukin-1 receptor domain-containing protein [Clostridia bacterium]